MTLHDQVVSDLEALCVAVLHEGTVYYGGVADTHYHLFAALDTRVTDDCCGFVCSKGTYYPRTEAALWVKSAWPSLWRLLDNRDVLESVDYAVAAGLPRKGLTLECGEAPVWATCVPVRSFKL